MDRYGILALPLAVFMWIGTLLCFIDFNQDWKDEFEQQYLDIVVNYCTDAATEDMIAGTSDLEMDYADFEYVNVNPDIALTTFCELMCDNLGYAVSEENIAYIRSNYLTTFGVAAYDGFYLAERTLINESGAHDTVFKPKVAYTFEHNGKTYKCNLDKKETKVLQGTSYIQVDSPITMAEQSNVINSTVSDLFMESVFKNTEQETTSVFYLPAGMSDITRTNPIDSVTVLAYVSGVELNAINKIDSFTIGGSRVVHEKFVGCYIKDGEKYYTYLTNLKGDENIIETYPNPTEAAKRGYKFDLTYFQ